MLTGGVAVMAEAWCVGQASAASHLQLMLTPVMLRHATRRHAIRLAATQCVSINPTSA